MHCQKEKNKTLKGWFKIGISNETKKKSRKITWLWFVRTVCDDQCLISPNYEHNIRIWIEYFSFVYKIVCFSTNHFLMGPHYTFNYNLKCKYICIITTNKQTRKKMIQYRMSGVLQLHILVISALNRIKYKLFVFISSLVFSLIVAIK